MNVDSVIGRTKWDFGKRCTEYYETIYILRLKVSRAQQSYIYCRHAMFIIRPCVVRPSVKGIFPEVATVIVTFWRSYLSTVSPEYFNVQKISLQFCVIFLSIAWDHAFPPSGLLPSIPSNLYTVLGTYLLEVVKRFVKFQILKLCHFCFFFFFFCFGHLVFELTWNKSKVE